MSARISGRQGEDIAARYMEKHGYKIEELNYRSRFGEIDIIAIIGDFIVFTEVKTRGDGAIYTPREAVDHRKQQRIINTAMLYLSEMHEYQNLQPRFDVAEVFGTTASFSINYIENAFGG